MHKLSSCGWRVANAALAKARGKPQWSSHFGEVRKI